MVPEPEKPDRVPPEYDTSLATKSVDALLNVKVSVAVSPAFSDVLLLATTMVGGDELNLDLQKLAIVNAQKPAVKCYLQPMDVEKPRPQKLK